MFTYSLILSFSSRLCLLLHLLRKNQIHTQTIVDNIYKKTGRIKTCVINHNVYLCKSVIKILEQGYNLCIPGLKNKTNQLYRVEILGM